MGCFHPLSAFRLPPGVQDPRGKTIVFSDPGRINGRECEEIQVPCGQCIGCRLQQSLDWAQRLEHEASLHDVSCFLTLTYDEEHLPYRARYSGGSLFYRDTQLFWKRLRKAGYKVRYYLAGEYGDHTRRAHYHAIVFGYFPQDAVLYKEYRGYKLYISEELQQIWQLGYVVIAPVTFETCAYVARYVLKKRRQSSPDFDVWYQGREPERAIMSRKPGIAHDWIERFHGDVYPSDSVVCADGKKRLRPSRYYDSIFDDIDHSAMRAVKEARLEHAKAHQIEQVRLDARESIVKSKLSLQVRKDL